jgi:hypothetical protein
MVAIYTQIRYASKGVQRHERNRASAARTFRGWFTFVRFALFFSKRSIEQKS